MGASNSSDTTCVVLLFMLLILVSLLAYLYRRLNRDTSGQYTVREMVLGKDGLRDRVRSGVVVVETRLGVHLWPRPRPRPSDEEAGEEGEEAGSARDSDVEEGQTQADEQKEGAGGAEGGGGESEHEEEDSEDDYSSMEGTDLRERAKLIKDLDEQADEQEKDRQEGGGKEEGPRKEREEEEEEKEEENRGLLVNLQEFSGSAIWSEEKKEDDTDIDLTAL
ncbi:hypothetical protein ACEWY4_024855 [Coilia grayii]|uniref:Uncharacterized protein n=1 Tax=Coilia grayii TaxID=363190 RepID=A0ABD1IXR5_9TELE